MLKPFVLMSLLSAITVNAVELKSTVVQTPLLELYTSEGCSSCPPADRWFSLLKLDKNLWHDYVPVAFHVDYWDYIGWRDPLASRANSNRQRTYKQQGQINSVYTPGIVFAGHEWRGFFRGRPLPQLELPEVGTLTAHLKGNQASIVFVPQNIQATQLDVHIAILGFGIKNHITAGENHGRTLEHDFVQIAKKRQTTRKGTNNQFELQMHLPKYDASIAQEIGIAIWLSTKDSQVPIQAVGGKLNI
ncbi:DUF1223 domain-containing protein [Pleionea sp. CnH1-48]|uniref:DUF1223 domain-containing protein n=1 Tax=Pleionea sp. CnH1-48 TaxID=2954494 RepID=UPI00209726A8|nr:DUF1223 domain-containing protein [Pleionea sp. CnH1-48]MCO7225888.1 DUF1223 domain-containing protein [Pleionea sp. CnH1-48]